MCSTKELYFSHFALFLSSNRYNLSFVALVSSKSTKNDHNLQLQNLHYFSFFLQTSGDFNLTRRCLRLCLSSDGSHGAALCNLAVISAQLGQHAKAKAYLIAAKAVLPDSDEVERNTKLITKYVIWFRERGRERETGNNGKDEWRVNLDRIRAMPCNIYYIRSYCVVDIKFQDSCFCSGQS